MKVYKTHIPEDSLVKGYLPANYSDAFCCKFTSTKELTADEILNAFFTIQPAWVKELFKLRNTLVKPFGLQTDTESGIGTICNKSENETVLLLEDKHLSAWLSIHIEKGNDQTQLVTLSTIVQFHYWLGYVYFYAIAPFHTLVVKGALKYTLNHLI